MEEKQPEPRPRAKNGTFLKGQPRPEGAGRQAKVLNKITADIKSGCIEGFSKHGSDGRGKDGFAGFCYFLAKRHPKAAARIVEKLLPLTVNSTGSGFANAIGVVNIMSVPSDRYLKAEDLARAQLPLLIDHADEQTIEQTNNIPHDGDDAA